VFLRAAISQRNLEHVPKPDASMLLELGCELAQGYGIARPMSANELPGWVKRSKPDPTWSDVALLPN
jgi:predicted signal transduction protein with EAL and GGDEF domain